VVDKLSPGRKRMAVCASNALSALMFLLLAIYGARMAWDEYRFEVTSPGLGLPTWIYTVWLPILALAICGRALGLMIRSWRGEN
ncbi:MAG TPA: TRAP transporter small permease subunit, partial [Syntrophales bacterium]|nr:TRAP transporter small permease subunit [Syntrophales bacterium]